MLPIILGASFVSLLYSVAKAENIDKKSSEISIKAYQVIAESEKLVEDKGKELDDAISSLLLREEKFIKILFKKFEDVFRPFQGISHILSESLFGERGLVMINSLQEQEEKNKIFEKILAPKYDMTSEEAFTVFLFGGMSGLFIYEANKNYDMAKSRRSQSKVLSSHAQTICLGMDICIENIRRIDKTLAGLGVLLVASISICSKFIPKKVGWLCGQDGRLPENISEQMLDKIFNDEEIDQISNCINIKKIIFELMQKPIFTTNQEISEEFRLTLKKGEDTINEIQNRSLMGV